jgi:hypothetical protein
VLSKIFFGTLLIRLRKWMGKHNILSQFYLGFVRGHRTTGKIFVIKTMLDKYLTFKRRIMKPERREEEKILKPEQAFKKPNPCR